MFYCLQKYVILLLFHTARRRSNFSRKYFDFCRMFVNVNLRARMFVDGQTMAYLMF